jgi:hypothetical protein
MATTGNTYKGNAGGDDAHFQMQHFVSALWSPRILKNVHDKQILAPLFTREYEGDLKGKGDTVKVHGVGAVAVQDYAVGDAIDYDTLTDAELLIEIDTAKYFAFKVEDIEAAQADPKYVSEASAEAAMAMAKASDSYLYNKLYVSAVNDTGDDWGQHGGTSTTNGGLMTCETATAANVYNAMVDAGVRLDDLLCPDDGRFFVIPSFAKGAVLKDDRFISYGNDGNGAARTNGAIGNIAGFDVIPMPRSTFAGRWNTANTNAVADLGVVSGTTADDYAGIFGRKGALAYVEQLTKLESLRLESHFADAVRGLHVWGSGALRPQWIGAMAFDDPAVTDS